MANTYPDGNPGEYPIDTSSTRGSFRMLFGDTLSVPYSPVENGIQDYTNFSDEEIDNFLVVTNDSTSRAVGYAYLQSAGIAALQSKTVADYDLKIDLTKRADDLRKMALFWLDLADTEDANSDAGNFFEIIETETVYPRIEAETNPYIVWP